MSDYTPTTAEVRGDYAHFCLAEFDRWLASVERAAAARALEEAAESKVKPSSIVDETALADKLKHWIFQYNQERITLKTFARAVAEYLAGGAK